MKCPGCQTDNPTSASFCFHCGAALTAQCTHCQAELPAGARFCPSCGQPVAAEPPEPTAPHASGGRRVATILFADISGFTSLAEKLDPEQVRAMMNSCFDRLVPIVEKYGGVIDKFIGDEIMALFGAPVAHEDDPARALYVAQEMMAAVPEFNAQNNCDLSIHIGVNTGLVVAGGIGSRGKQQFTVIGDAVNLAARLRAKAEQGEVLVGPDTYQQVAPLFEFEPRGPVPVKGRGEPVPIYQLLGRRVQPGRLRGIAGLESPLVGRTAELAVLRQAVQEVCAGHQRIVLLIGEAGMGKSRLIAEWQTAAAGSSPPRWATGHSLSYGQQLDYHLLVDALCGLLGVPAGGDRLHEALLSCTQEVLGNAWTDVYPYLGHLLSVELEEEALERVRWLDAQSLQARYVSAIRRFLQALSAQRPLALIFEDIHWADPASVALLVELLPALAGAPLLFCFITRPDAEAVGWQVVSAAQKCAGPQLAEVHLQALSDNESQRLIANLLEVESLPEAIGGLILKKAEGNPFFVEEMIRMLVDRGVIVRQDGSWVAKMDAESLHVPDNLQGLLLARIDRLPEAARQVARVAAVIGRRFSAAVIAEVLGKERVISWPEYLESAGLIFRAAAEPEQEFAFRHALVWEAAYNSLLLEERRHLHGAVGEALEHLYPEQLGELTAALAYHFAEAGDTSRAFTYSTLAGDTAYQRYAVPEAIAHYTRALEIGRRTPQAVPEGAWRHLYTSRGRLLELDGRYAQALENYAEMEELARQRGDTAMELSATIEHARIHCEPNVSHDPVQGQALADRALALALQTQDRAAEARVHWVLMLLNWLTGNPASALAHGEASLALARELGLREQLAYTLHDIHRAYLNKGQRDEAEVVLAEARRLWREIGNLPMLADNLNSAADIAADNGKNDQALAFAAEAFSISQSIGNLWNQAFAREIAGEVYVQQGLMDAAFETFLEALALSEQAGLVILNMRAALRQAWAYVYLGAAEMAYERIARIREKFASPHSSFTAFYRVYGTLQIALMYGRFGDWRAEEQVLAELLQSDVPSPIQSLVRSMGNWYFAQLQIALLRGDQEQLRAVLQEIDTDEWTRPTLFMQMQWYKGEGLLALGELEKSADCLYTALELSRAFQDRQTEWQLLRLLKQIERRRGGETTTLTRQGRAVVDFIAAHVSDPSQRATFLHRADVAELCAD